MQALYLLVAESPWPIGRLYGPTLDCALTSRSTPPGKAGAVTPGVGRSRSSAEHGDRVVD